MSSSRHISSGPNLRPLSRIAKFPHLTDDNRRLDTFRGWRGHQDMDLKSLVESGFFYTNDGDGVQCYVCGIIIRTWTLQMDPLLEHVRKAPFCRHLPELLPLEILAEIKDQLFGLDIMRVPSSIPLDENRNKYTGRRVERTDHLSSNPPMIVGHSGHHDRCSGIIQQEQGTDVEQRTDVEQCTDVEQGPYVEQVIAASSVRGEFAGEPSTNPVNSAVDIRDMLNTPAAQSLLQNGYDHESVRMAIIDLYEQGHRNLKSTDIVQVIDSREDSRSC